MKLKRLPDDFRVEELPAVQPGARGRYTFYCLTKRGLGTPEAVDLIVRRWNLARSQVGYGGLKDRHALTVQYLTILNGPARLLREPSFTLEPLGRLTHPYGPSHFAGNRFQIVLRDLSRAAAAHAVQALAELPRDGLPNYFDAQRFGSVGFDGGFIAEAWLKGDPERALFLAIAAPNPADRLRSRAEKAVLRDCWGRWPEAKARLPRSHARSLVTYLADHPDDFRGAFARLRRDLRSIYFSAYQSYLWNLLLGRWIEQITQPDQRIYLDFKVATLPIHHGLDPAQVEPLSPTHIPLPSARTPLPEGPLRAIAVELLRTRGLTWETLRIKHLKDVFFSKGDRPAFFFARNLTHALAPDDLYPGRRKLTLAFELPKGAYATILVKRVTLAGLADEPTTPAADFE
jgi:tRNA pseudouridine13 synthase